MAYLSYIAPFSAEAISNLLDALAVSWKGLLGIFIIMFLFYIIIIGLSKIKDKK